MSENYYRWLRWAKMMEQVEGWTRTHQESLTHESGCNITFALWEYPYMVLEILVGIGSPSLMPGHE